MFYIGKENIMLYEIIMDCRIANKDYRKGDVVSRDDVEYFPSVMRPFSWKATPKAEAPKVEEPKVEEVVEETEEKEEEEEEVVRHSKKRHKKK